VHPATGKVFLLEAEAPAPPTVSTAADPTPVAKTRNNGAFVLDNGEQVVVGTLLNIANNERTRTATIVSVSRVDQPQLCMFETLWSGAAELPFKTEDVLGLFVYFKIKSRLDES
jgi:hypothetical protein